MDILYTVSLLNNISFTLFVVSPTVFVFSVTLLGTAIEKSQEEEEIARENDKTNLQNEIDNIEKIIIKAKEDGNTSNLTDELENLKRRQLKSEKKIKEIKIKYETINLTNSVLYPCSALFLIVFLNFFIDFFTTQSWSIVIIIFSEILLTMYSAIKIYKSLILVQKISANKKENDHYLKIKDHIKIALQEYDQEKTEEVELIFVEKAFPLNTAPSTELEIKFKIKLKKGNVLNNVCVWFFIADGFDLIKPKEFWKQDSSYNPPNIRTVKISIGKLSKGPYTPGDLKIKTPATSGKYLIRYRVYADGFFGSQKDLSILVG
jgi:hypothetical protein